MKARKNYMNKSPDLFKPDDICVVRSKTSTHNGQCVKVIRYPHKNRDDIIIVKSCVDEKQFLITEDSLKPACRIDKMSTALAKISYDNSDKN